jgi:hypothetical protein
MDTDILKDLKPAHLPPPPSWWPPAWPVVVIAVVLVTALGFLIWHLRTRRPWAKLAIKELQLIEHKYDDIKQKEVLQADIAALFRRLASAYRQDQTLLSWELERLKPVLMPAFTKPQALTEIFFVLGAGRFTKKPDFDEQALLQKTKELFKSCRV